MESALNLTLSYFALSYSFINLVKARVGKQRLDRHFRIAWEILQLLFAAAAGARFYRYRLTSIAAVMDYNGELLRKTTARGAEVCGNQDSCIVFTVNLVILAGAVALVMAITPQVIAVMLDSRDRRPTCSNVLVAIIPEDIRHSIRSRRIADGSGASFVNLTSFERECLGAPFTALFSDCDDFAYVISCDDARLSNVDAVLLGGFLYYGDYLYLAGDVMLLLLARLLPSSILRSFNIVFMRWHLDPESNTVSHPLACPWYKASAELAIATRAAHIK